MSESTDQPSADFVIIMSPEQIEVILKEYFNTVMFKNAVEVVSNEPTPAGYMFGLNWSQTVSYPTEVPLTTEIVDTVNIVTRTPRNGHHRNSKGKFVKPSTADAG